MQEQQLQAVVDFLIGHQLRIVTAESCTAGLIASTLAIPPGCGKWLESAFVTYSEDAKIRCLEVDQQIIEREGLTSEAVAIAMAEGALQAADANLALATTGVAGPSNGDGQEPVGTVCFGWSFRTASGIRSFSEKAHFDGDRNAVREAATVHALTQIATHHQHLMAASAAARTDKPT